ncbi:hypothetical protein [Blastococcus montanus]|uniref:endonuclease domain-containing protein n=1 Tax=Blastococcus montanus TaxID=3144973 RepID=UPI00320B3388
MHSPDPAPPGTVFRGTDALRRGTLTRAQLRCRRRRRLRLRLRQDVYCDAALPVTDELAARAVLLTAPRQAALGGGVGVTVRTATTTGDLVGDGALVLTGRTRTALDLIRRPPVDEAVVLLDRLVHSRVALLDDVRAAALRQPRCRGSRQAREVAALADGLAESPQETRLRLLLHRAGLPAPVAQYEVRHERTFVARLDFAYPEHRLAIEYDGVWHGDRAQFARDRQRLNRLLAAGWRVLFVTAADLRDPVALVARVAAALAG